jgi:hypothetical protein
MCLDLLANALLLSQDVMSRHERLTYINKFPVRPELQHDVFRPAGQSITAIA